MKNELVLTDTKNQQRKKGSTPKLWYHIKVSWFAKCHHISKVQIYKSNSEVTECMKFFNGKNIANHAIRGICNIVWLILLTVESAKEQMIVK